jgi:lysyl-tRNA synthetase class I
MKCTRRTPMPLVNRKFRGKPSKTLTIRIEVDTIRAVDEYMQREHRAMRGNRSELIRRLLGREVTRSEQQIPDFHHNIS